MIFIIAAVVISVGGGVAIIVSVAAGVAVDDVVDAWSIRLKMRNKRGPGF